MRPSNTLGGSVSEGSHPGYPEASQDRALYHSDYEGMIGVSA